MGLVFNLGDGDNARIVSKSLASYQDSNGNYEGVEVNNLRAGVANETNKDGLLQEVGTDVLRFDYSENANGEILTEGEATNIYTYSNNFSNGYWTVTRGSVIDNSIVSPSGDLDGHRYEGDGDSSSHFLRRTVPITNTVYYTGSVYLKKSTNSTVFLRSDSQSRWVAGAEFDLDLGIVSDVTSGTASIKNIGDDWYRCSITGECVQTTNGGMEIAVSNGGNIGDGLYLWGAQFEEGKTATSYIYTNGSSQERAADTGITTGDISHLINSEEGVLEVEIAALGNGLLGTRRISLSDGTNNNRIVIAFPSATPDVIQFFLFANGSTVISTQQINVGSQDVKRKYKIKYKSGDLGFSVDNVEVYSSSNSFSFSSPLSFFKLSNVTGANIFYGRLSYAKIYDSANDY